MLILLVEDEALIAYVMKQALEYAGHEVLGPAASGKNALRLAETRRPDIALVDVNLSDGCGKGLYVAETLAERWQVPSLFVTAQQVQSSVRDDDMVIDVIPKPFRPEAVVHRIDRFMTDRDEDSSASPTRERGGSGCLH